MVSLNHWSYHKCKDGFFHMRMYSEQFILGLTISGPRIWHFTQCICDLTDILEVCYPQSMLRCIKCQHIWLLHSRYKKKLMLSSECFTSVALVNSESHQRTTTRSKGGTRICWGEFWILLPWSKLPSRCLGPVLLYQPQQYMTWGQI